MSDQEPENEIPLTFDAWADLSARLVKLDPEAREEVLEEHDLELDAWARCDGHYAQVLVDDLRAGRMDRAQAYAGRFTQGQGATPAPVLPTAGVPAPARGRS